MYNDYNNGNLKDKKLVYGQTQKFGVDLETLKNKKCNHTMYFCVLGYMK